MNSKKALVISVSVALILAILAWFSIWHSSVQANTANNCGKYYGNSIAAASTAEIHQSSNSQVAVAWNQQSLAWSAIYENCKKYGGG